MKRIKISFFIIVLVFVFIPAVFCKDFVLAQKNDLSLDEILNRIEKRYAGPGFTAGFFQTSTLQAMDITDTASGRIFVKRPAMMRWEYQTPDVQTITTDGQTLWIYRPEDQQVIIGKAPAFFSDGKGAGFLSDLGLLRRKFYITLAKELKQEHYQLKLFPLTKTLDVSVVYLSVDKKTFNIVRIVTLNSYGDTTRIDLKAIRTNRQLDDALFKFQIPKGVEILHLEE